MLPVFEDYLSNHNCDPEVKLVFEIVSNDVQFNYLESREDLQDKINSDTFMSNVVCMISEGYSPEWTSVLANPWYALSRVRRAYEMSPKREEDLERFIQSFGRSDVFADYVRSHVKNVFANTLHDFHVRDYNDITIEAEFYEHDWNHLISEGRSEYWTEFYLSSHNFDVFFAIVRSRLYEFLRQNGHSCEEALDAVDLTNILSDDIKHKSKQISLYSSDEKRFIAESLANCIADYNEINDDRGEFIEDFVCRYLESMSSNHITNVSSIQAELMTSYAKEHPDWENERIKKERIRAELIRMELDDELRGQLPESLPS